MFVIDPDYQEAKGTDDAALKRQYWETAKGLQAVDNLETSPYLEALIEEAVSKNYNTPTIIKKLKEYYDGRGAGVSAKTREPDLVAARIEGVLEQGTSFSFSPLSLKNIHRILFQDVLPPEWVGDYRAVDIIKKEDILCGQSVNYAPHGIIQEQLQYDFDSEKQNRYRLPIDQQQISRLAAFTSAIWQTHPFREGNTRTTATFLIQYLRSMGLGISNAPFRDNSRFFRNALVRSNYTNLPSGIEADMIYLVIFFENILLNAQHDLGSLDLTCYQLA